MSERVRIYVGERLTTTSGMRRPTISFDLLPGVELLDALRELVSSMERKARGEIVAGPPPRTNKMPLGEYTDTGGNFWFTPAQSTPPAPAIDDGTSGGKDE